MEGARIYLIVVLPPFCFLPPSENKLVGRSISVPTEKISSSSFPVSHADPDIFNFYLGRVVFILLDF